MKLKNIDWEEIMELKVVSLFSGGGGLDLGFKEEGYNIIWAIDNNKNAVQTYKANIGEHIVNLDINDIKLENIPKADIVIGGPPCQSFSLAGKRNVEDERGKLVWKYLEIIDYIKPKAFVFENVTGINSAKNSEGVKILDLLKQAFEKIGYTISAEVLNAADYGVPQKRKRVIIVGLKNKKSFIFPQPTHSEDGVCLKKYISVKEALDDLPDEGMQENEKVKYIKKAQNDYQKMMRTNLEVTEHILPKMSELDKYIISYVKPGGNYMDIPKNVNSTRIQRLQKEGGHTTCYGRMDPDKPSYTINTYFNRPNVGCNIHYSKNRLITVREALRLQSFPDSYILISSSKQGKNLIVGNAVPPLLAKIIAKELKKYVGD
jgi:DNA (cytosine-5)-methyltransferase 1